MTQPVRTAPSTQYGEAAASARQQSAQPLPQTPGIPTQIAGLMAPVQGEGAAPGLLRESERPQEPFQAGLGAGPQADDYDLLRALKEQYPTAGMDELFQAMGFQ
jgi:hypothetical protein